LSDKDTQRKKNGAQSFSVKPKTVAVGTGYSNLLETSEKLLLI
jgi:hypothetical protein